MKFVYNQIILQPTSFCNLDCSYCYLPDRKVAHRMLSSVTARLAEDLLSIDGKKRIVWHGGEPLSTGIDYFSDLVKPFLNPKLQNKVVHSVQTNCTLLNDEWCELFKQHNFKVGISIDGPNSFNNQRVDLKGRETYEKVIGGVKLLKKHNIQFSVIAVIGKSHYNKAKVLYDFFTELGCSSVGFNTQEDEGINLNISEDTEEINEFWREIFLAWKANPVIRVRELGNVLAWMKQICSGKQTYYDLSSIIDLIPTISWDGNIVTLSPELHGAKSKKYNDFIVGNILDMKLQDILKKAETEIYVKEFIEGWNSCKRQCEYFEFCGGGQASNKFYEHGILNTTETIYCRNVKKRLVNSIIETL